MSEAGRLTPLTLRINVLRKATADKLSIPASIRPLSKWRSSASPTTSLAMFKIVAVTSAWSRVATTSGAATLATAAIGAETPSVAATVGMAGKALAVLSDASASKIPFKTAAAYCSAPLSRTLCANDIARLATPSAFSNSFCTISTSALRARATASCCRSFTSRKLSKASWEESSALSSLPFVRWHLVTWIFAIPMRCLLSLRLAIPRASFAALNALRFASRIALWLFASPAAMATSSALVYFWKYACVIVCNMIASPFLSSALRQHLLASISFCKAISGSSFDKWMRACR
mmetsp:Transcript_28704/g.46216  ORF Transcript_28704/g.46216 Transcript_28704/m.46216 type:complete len:291 (+) Transcript_28704:203-1075(+)